MNQFNTITAQPALEDIYISESEKKPLIIRSLPKSMSVISTVVSATPTMTMGTIDALVREKIEH